ncbi:unnamed protein product [Vitrella brassicaformis CCMP3155]|uniref:Inward rectifier potassium channel C-terminal domain-containing protein n=1 Tax=Vitrella brassicaformis (strain CCMP3155) TaxID=1169540 RepID=A0A0G4FHK6_VITBC|nr:unnamed protein product [Vitrella brassicaformis CCMP3155]|eukprot:CEM13001.1 unnamed protein product [Vitrella brassicaformis CCMP3155]
MSPIKRALRWFNLSQTISTRSQREDHFAHLKPSEYNILYNNPRVRRAVDGATRLKQAFRDPDFQVKIINKLWDVSPTRWLAKSSWWLLLTLVIAIAAAFSITFALVIMARSESFYGFDDDLIDVQHDPFLRAFAISLANFMGINYPGGPRDPTGTIILAIQSFFSKLLVVLGTGLVLMKFSRPRSHICFSDRMTVYEHHREKGQIWAKFRVAPSADQLLGSVAFKVSVEMTERTSTGEWECQFKEVSLDFSPTVVMMITNVRVHLNAPNNPFAGMNMEQIKERLDSVSVWVSGFDDVNGRMVTALESWEGEKIMWEAVFDDYFYVDPNEPNKQKPTQFVCNWARINTVIRPKQQPASTDEPSTADASISDRPTMHRSVSVGDDEVQRAATPTEGAI